MTTREQEQDDQPQRTPENLLEFMAICELLENCIVRASYVVPDRLIAPIILSTDGFALYEKVRERHRRIKPNEAKLAVALAFGYHDKLFVSTETDIDRFRAAIGREIQDYKILYPMIFGRRLHDSMADSHLGMPELDTRTSVELVSGGPQGVFQVAHTVVGPYGCFEVRTPRHMPPSRDIPGYLCSDETCQTIHPITLNTGGSNITRAREKVDEELERQRIIGHSERPKQVARDYNSYTKRYELENPASMVELLADSCTLGELHRICDEALRNYLREPANRAALNRTLSVAISDPTMFANSLGLEQAISLLLYFDKSELRDAIGAVVDRGEIVIPDGQIRVARINRFGNSGIVTELGQLGIRYRSKGHVAFGAQQITELVRSLGLSGARFTTEDLTYALDLPEITPLDAIASHVFEQLTPLRLIDEVILPSRAAAAAASEHLGLQRYKTSERSNVRSRMLWMLGESMSNLDADLLKTEQEVQHIRSLMTAAFDETSVRGAIANLFSSLETALLSALKFCAWSLTTDHFLHEMGFSFDWLDAADSLLNLDPHGIDPGRDTLWNDGEMPSLAQLASGYGRLAKVLAELRDNGQERPAAQIPPVCREQSRPFAFHHLETFLNLTSDSQTRVLDALQLIARLGQHDSVIGVRNAGLHGNNTFPSPTQIDECTIRVNDLTRSLRKTGFYPQAFTRSSSETDSSGREWISYSNATETIKLPMTTWVVAPRFPGSAQELIIMPCARFDGLGPLRFSIRPQFGSRGFWDGWPTRSPSSAQYRTNEPQPTPQQETAAG